ncbi:MAG: hypothetical protein M1819_005778 [Sarea resinae]|nr:MAG: hypothetical protein M1819_005778 [Sarea resinae]
MSLPPIAPFPPASLRRTIVPEEWEACLDAWILLTQTHLRLSPKEFHNASSHDGAPLVIFLKSYIHEVANAQQQSPIEAHLQAPKARVLRRECFLLCHRCLLEHEPAPPPPPPLLNCAFLQDLSVIYVRSQSLRSLLSSVWSRHHELLEPELQRFKTSLTQNLESSKVTDLKGLDALLFASPDIARFFAWGSDFIDALPIAYKQASSSPALKKELVAAVYLTLASLTEGDKPNLSLLFDHFWSLKKAATDNQRPLEPASSLLADLLTNTPLLRKVEERFGASDAARTKALIDSVQAFRGSGATMKRQRARRLKVPSKGKGRATDEHADLNGEIHIHRMSLVTQIQDLFPDLGAGFIVKLLDEYNDDIEQVTAHLLDDSLPPHLHDADRKEELYAFPPLSSVSFLGHSNQPNRSLPTPSSSAHPAPANLIPHSTPPPSKQLPLPPTTTTTTLPPRRNIHDNDAFSRLAISSSQIHIGPRTPASQTADALLSSPHSRPKKEAILSALAAFDSDDDERDDTYDASDVGGTVDTTAEEPRARPADTNTNTNTNTDIDALLYPAYSAPNGGGGGGALFARSTDTRRGPARAALRRETGLTDEAIEGWALMLARDPGRARRLHARFALGGGAVMAQQPELRRSGWRASNSASATDDVDDGDEDEDEDEDEASGGGASGGAGPAGPGGRGRGGSDSRGRGGRGGRGGGGGRGRGRGDVSGAPGGEKEKEKGTPASRQRKEAHKSSRANHNRRDQRARKMARGGFPG